MAISANTIGALRIDGTLGDDKLTGTLFDDEIHGGAGDDDLLGNGGNDLLDGGAGDDIVFGGSGNDMLQGGDGGDLMSGDEGNDTLDGGSGSNLLAGGEGDDHYEIHSLTDMAIDTAGHDSGTIYVDWYKTDPDVEDWTWAPGVKKLPYWIDALAYAGMPFVAANLDARTIYYSFAQTPPNFFSDDDKSGFKPFNGAQMTYTRQVLAYIESVLDVRFVPTGDAEGSDTIVFAVNAQEDSAGYGSPLQPIGSGAKVLVANSFLATNPDRDKGAEFLRVVTHEIGHALGLKHPFDDTDVLGQVGLGPYLPETEDNVLNSVMSYTGIERKPGEYSPFDIAALQYLYGPSRAYHGGDTLYTIGSDALMIGDGSGNDTIDGSAQTQDLTLSLEAGAWSHAGAQAATITARGQLTIDIGSVIENAIGGAGNDHIDGNAASNRLTGGAGKDVLRGAGGNDAIDGGAGLDTAVFAGARADFKLVQLDGALFVQDNKGSEGTDSLTGVERVAFSDGALAFDIEGNAGQLYRLYAAAFDRKPDLSGLGFWIGQRDSGQSMLDIATAFTHGQEFVDIYGATHTHDEFLTKLYQHILHRAPDEKGYAFWSKALDDGISEARVLADFSEGKENHDQVAAQVQDGIWYIPGSV